MKLILVIMIIRCCSSLDRKWVDPHDMNTNAKQKLEKLGQKDSVLETSTSGESENQHQCNCSEKNKNRVSEELSFVYLKRIVSLLINSGITDVNDVKKRIGKFVLDVEDDNYKFLLEFIKNKEVDIKELRQLDSVLTNLFQRKIADDIFDTVISTQEKFLGLLLDVKTLILAAVFVALYITYHLRQAQFSFSYILKYFVVVIVIVDFAYRYQILLEEAEEHNFKVISEKCKEMAWYNYLFSKKEDCEKKMVTPLEVLLVQARHIIIIPLSSVGAGTGKFAAELWGSIPWPWHFFVFPIMLLFVLLMVAVVMTICNNSAFKFNLMHLFHFEFGGRERDHGNRINGPTLDKLLDAVNNRQRLQDVRTSPDKNIRKEVKDKNNSSKKNEKINTKPRQKRICDNKQSINSERNSGISDNIQSINSENNSSISDIVSDITESKDINIKTCNQSNPNENRISSKSVSCDTKPSLQSKKNEKA